MFPTHLRPRQERGEFCWQLWKEEVGRHDSTNQDRGETKARFEMGKFWRKAFGKNLSEMVKDSEEFLSKYLGKSLLVENDQFLLLVAYSRFSTTYIYFMKPALPSPLESTLGFNLSIKDAFFAVPVVSC